MRESKAYTGTAYVLLSLGAMVMVAPFIWMMLSAFKQPKEIVAIPPVWIPTKWTLASFERVLTRMRFDLFYANSLAVSSVVTIIVLYTSTLCGFVFRKYEFWGRDALFLLLLATMMVPWPVTLIPAYLVTVWLGLVNSLEALIIPSIFSTFGIFLMRQHMDGVPDELLDAARIDGASEVYIFHRIAFPLCMPAVAALGIFTFLWNWNAFLWPLIVLSDQKLYTLPVGLAMFQGQYWTDYAGLMAGTAIAVIPMIIVFLVLQRHIVEGVALTGLKM